MQCRTAQHQLSAYMDGELRAEEKKRIQQHLAGCDDCRRALEETGKMWNLLDVLPEPKPSPYLYTRISARLEHARTFKTRHWIERLLLPVSATAAAVLGIWLGSLAGRNGEAVTENGKTEDPIVLSYADHFDDFPAASISNAYFTLEAQE